jgi:hypothetical protein
MRTFTIFGRNNRWSFGWFAIISGLIIFIFPEIIAFFIAAVLVTAGAISVWMKHQINNQSDVIQQVSNEGKFWFYNERRS